MNTKEERNQMARAVAWTATIVLMLLGCSQQQSSSQGDPLEGGPFPTRSMYMHLFAEARDASESARVIAVLTREGDTLANKEAFGIYPEHDFILDGGDSMQGCLAGGCQPLEMDVLSGLLSSSAGGYEAYFPVVANADYTVMLHRPNAVSATATRTQIPSSFALTAPYPHQMFGPGEQVVVAWQPLGLDNAARVIADIACTMPGGGPGTFGSAGVGRLNRRFPQHQGSVSIPVDELVSLARASQSGNQVQIGECRIFLDVAHERSGTVDPAFRGGESIGRYWIETEVSYRQ